MMKRFFTLIALCLLAPAVFAAPNFFTPSANDQSLYFLAAIFGDVGTVLNLGGSTLLRDTFYYFNQAVLVLGCIVILYSLIVSTINTSHQGEMLGSKWNSVWIPLRSAMGFALLLPTNMGTVAASGTVVKSYAVIQVFIMWVIVQGVGAADYLWSNMVDNIVSGDAKIQADVASSNNAADTMMSAYQYFACAIGLVQVQGYQDYTTRDPSHAPSRYQNQDHSKFKNCNINWCPSDKNYINAAPHIFSTATGANTATPNTNFWTFGVIIPNGNWSIQSVCGSITSPIFPGNGNAALKAYYNNQRDILAKALGVANSAAGATNTSYLSNGQYPLFVANSNYQLRGTAPNYLSDDTSWGTYGGNWLGDYGTASTITKRAQSPNSLNGVDKGLLIAKPQVDKDGNILRDAQGNTLYNSVPTPLPTIAYLAELSAEYSDMTGSTSYNLANPAVVVQPVSQTPGSPDVLSDPSQIPQYVQQELALIAQAYTDAMAENYRTYQAALADQEAAASVPPIAGSEKGSLGMKLDLAAAAKFNGWASAGAFYLDIAKVLQATTSDIAVATDYSYGALACTVGVGVSTDEITNMLCKDARSPADVGGKQGGHGHKDNKKKQSGSYLGNVISNAQNMTLQALNLMPDWDTAGMAQTTPPTGGTYDGYTQNYGIYNSTDTSGFSALAVTKPRFPKMIINPLAWYNYVNGMMIYNFAQAITPMLKMAQGSTMANPILTLRQSGIRLLNSSAQLYHVGQKYMWISGLTSYVASNWSPIAGAAFSTFNWAASMATTMVAMMMSMGAIMAYYFPMIPYLVFTFATIQWLVLTVEAMTAAPLMALGILHPEGQHEVFGHSSMGIAILSTVFLRPPLMIVGYFAATVMCYVVVLLLNAGFFFAANSMLTGSTSTGSVFGCVVVWMMYLNTVMIAINKAFSLIYHIPDHVTRWIGITEGHASDVEKMMEEVKGGVKQGGDLAKGAKDSRASAQTSTAGQAFQKRGGKE